MRIVFGADHAGYELKRELVEGLRETGKYRLDDIGVRTLEPADYADIAHQAAELLLRGHCDRAVLIDATGTGMSIAANRHAGIRAACCSDVFTARSSRAHQDTNVLALGGRVLGIGLAWEIVDAWLATEFTGTERHQRRVRKIEMHT